MKIIIVMKDAAVIVVANLNVITAVVQIVANVQHILLNIYPGENMMVEKLRAELYRYIDRFGLNDPLTIRKSQQLDRALNLQTRKKEQRKKVKMNKFILQDIEEARGWKYQQIKINLSEDPEESVMSKVIILDKLDFQWETTVIDKVIDYWNEGFGIKDISMFVKRSNTETFLLLMDLDMKGKIKKRNGYVWGNR